MLLSRSRRQAFSLIEVILAFAIFLLSITGLVFLMGIANANAMEAQMRSQAISIAQSRLAEVSAGVIGLSGQSESKCEDDSDYQWSMDVDPGSYNGLYNVTVHVSRKRANGTKLECSLSQMVFDPKSIGTVFDSAQDPNSTASATDSGSSGSSSSSSPAKSPTPAAAPSMSKPSDPDASRSGGSAPKAGPSPSPAPTTPKSSPSASPSPATPKSSGSKTGG